MKNSLPSTPDLYSAPQDNVSLSLKHIINPLKNRIKHLVVIAWVTIMAYPTYAQISTLSSDFQSNITSLLKPTAIPPTYNGEYDFCDYLPSFYQKYSYSDVAMTWIGQKLYVPQNHDTDGKEFKLKLDEQCFYDLDSGYYTILDVTNDWYNSYLNKTFTSFNSSFIPYEIPYLFLELMDSLTLNENNLRKAKSYPEWENYQQELIHQHPEKEPQYRLAFKLVKVKKFLNNPRGHLRQDIKDVRTKSQNLVIHISRFYEESAKKSVLWQLLDPSGDTVYMTNIKPGISVAYFEYVKKTLEGKEWFYTSSLSTQDFFTGEKLELQTTKYDDFIKNHTHPYRCTQVVLHNNTIAAIMEDNNTKFLIRLDDINPYNLQFHYNFQYHEENNPNNGWVFDRFVSKSFFESKKRTLQELANKTAAQRAQEAQAWAKTEKEKEQKHLANMIRLYGQDKGTAIANHEIRIGMTRQMCKDAWGNPFRIHKDIRASIETEIWSYGSSTLHFVNDELKRIVQDR